MRIAPAVTHCKVLHNNNARPLPATQLEPSQPTVGLKSKKLRRATSKKELVYIKPNDLCCSGRRETVDLAQSPVPPLWYNRVELERPELERPELERPEGGRNF
jgi:hypothetical protein